MNKDQMKKFGAELERYADHVLAIVLANRLNEQARMLVAIPEDDIVANQSTPLPKLSTNKDKSKLATNMVCANCGEAGTVPFTPKNDKPLLCRACWEKR